MGNFNIYPNDDKPCWTTSIQQSGQTNDPLTWHDLGENFGKTTQILHNGQGVFVPWSAICGQAQAYLLQSCSELIGSDGNLTTAGYRAVGCVINGVAYGSKAVGIGLPLNLAKGLLALAAPLTGCGGIVDMNKIQDSPELRFVINAVNQVK